VHHGLVVEPSVRSSSIAADGAQEPEGAATGVCRAVGTLSLTEPVLEADKRTDPAPARWWDVLLTWMVVLGPLLVLVVAVNRFWHHGIGWFDLSLAVVFYLVTGFGITLGFHRLFSHRSFRARRALRIALAVAGSMAAEGSVISWVSHHRRHHVYADRPGDPHSPWTVEQGTFRRLRGLFHAHMGWLFGSVQSSPSRWGRDLLADRDVVVISRLAPLWAALSVILPFAIGWAVTRSLAGAILAMVWAGGVRIALLHHVTWSVNSLGHMFGKRPYESADRSGNVRWLSVLSLGDSWHNSHHAFPALARHGRDGRQLDPSAAVLRVLESLNWVSHVRWSRDRLPSASGHRTELQPFI
jgi:stearoyl-CoA desaturase (Delta-9 desaturase)